MDSYSSFLRENQGEAQRAQYTFFRNIINYEHFFARGKDYIGLVRWIPLFAQN
jgi:hypothetical protein